MGEPSPAPPLCLCCLPRLYLSVSRPARPLQPLFSSSSYTSCYSCSSCAYCSSLPAAARLPFAAALPGSQPRVLSVCPASRGAAPSSARAFRAVPLALQVKECPGINLPAIIRRANSHAARRSVKSDWQAAWYLRAVTCIDLTTLSGDDTPANVKRLCFKAKVRGRG